MQIASNHEQDPRVFGGLATADAHALAGVFEAKAVAKAQHLARQGDPDDKEYILLSGRMVSLIGDAEGREVCVGFFVGPCVITPNLARTAQGKSLVSLRAETDGQAASVEATVLLDMMRGAPAIEDWANAVLRAELERKTKPGNGASPHSRPRRGLSCFVASILIMKPCSTTVRSRRSSE